MRILIIKTSSLGDLFRALPAVHLLKSGSQAEIDWVVNSEYAALVKCFSDVRRVVPFPRRNLLPNLGNFLKELRVEEYDLIVDLPDLPFGMYSFVLKKSSLYSILFIELNSYWLIFFISSLFSFSLIFVSLLLLFTCI